MEERQKNNHKIRQNRKLAIIQNQWTKNLVYDNNFKSSSEEDILESDSDEESESYDDEYDSDDVTISNK